MSDAPCGLLLVQVINELILKMYFWGLDDIVNFILIWIGNGAAIDFTYFI